MEGIENDFMSYLPSGEDFKTRLRMAKRSLTSERSIKKKALITFSIQSVKYEFELNSIIIIMRFFSNIKIYFFQLL